MQGKSTGDQWILLTKGPVMWKTFSCHNVIMLSVWHKKPTIHITKFFPLKHPFTIDAQYISCSYIYIYTYICDMYIAWECTEHNNYNDKISVRFALIWITPDTLPSEVWILWVLQRKMTTVYQDHTVFHSTDLHHHQYKEIIIKKEINCFHLQETTVPLGSQCPYSQDQCLYTATQHRKLMLLQRIQHNTALFTRHCLQMVSLFHQNFMDGHCQWPKPQVCYLVPGQVKFP